MSVSEEMNRFSIKDIENLTGIKAHTIRIWEQRYNIFTPKRTPTNIRYYDALDLKMALRIALLNNYGYKISHIHEMSEQDMNSLIQKINDKDFRLQLLVNDLLEATLAMDMQQFEKLVNTFIKRYGIEDTVEQLFFNFLEKIGIMWMTDRILPAQEHLVSNVIYRKIAIAIENLVPQQKTDGPTVLLFLPEGEIHDIGLLYVHYLALKYGKNSIYLGPNSPLKEVQMVAEIKKPEYLFVHLTSVASSFDCNQYLTRLTTAVTDSKIFVSGSMLQNLKLKTFPTLKYLHSLKEVRDTLVALS
ncbi:MAG: MerR family transcriptional regulator [Bacteroidetes bacterium]|nr:MerR family transcriptional regulator [Bacteroidota bacterium]